MLVKLEGKKIKDMDVCTILSRLRHIAQTKTLLPCRLVERNTPFTESLPDDHTVVSDAQILKKLSQPYVTMLYSKDTAKDTITPASTSGLTLTPKTRSPKCSKVKLIVVAIQRRIFFTLNKSNSVIAVQGSRCPT